MQQVEVRQPPYSHKLVGHPFKLGPNPRVDAQFSVQYCVANAIVRGSARLDIAPGYPGNSLSETQHLGRFHDCLAYAALQLPAGQVQDFLDGVQGLSSLADARVLLQALTLR